MATTVSPPLKWFGGKNYLAPKIVALFPRHLHYVEPYAGGLSVLLDRDPNDKSLWLADDGNLGGVSEVVNDLNKELVNFWTVLRSADLFPEFCRQCQATSLSHPDYDRAGDFFGLHPDPVVRAWAFFVRCRQSRAGTFKGFTSLTRNRTRRGINGNASEWLSAVDNLPAVHARLWPVVIENMDAVKLIRREDGPHTLYYLDPPYMHETRTGNDDYAHEMTEAQHIELLDTLAGLKGKFLLSGYHSDLYDGYAAKHGWKVHEFDLPNNAAGGKEKRRMVECLWLNY